MSATPKQPTAPDKRGANSLYRRVAAVEREAAFYREQLELICKDTRKTRARRLAESALTFWDEMKRAGTKCSDQGDGFWDCAKLQHCVKPQCADCPQKAANH